MTFYDVLCELNKYDEEELKKADVEALLNINGVTTSIPLTWRLSDLKKHKLSFRENTGIPRNFKSRR